jgi:hypothetical protein
MRQQLPIDDRHAPPTWPPPPPAYGHGGVEVLGLLGLKGMNVTLIA